MAKCKALTGSVLKGLTSSFVFLILAMMKQKQLCHIEKLNIKS